MINFILLDVSSIFYCRTAKIQNIAPSTNAILMKELFLQLNKKICNYFIIYRFGW
jgi:hypothetical protein